MIPLVSASAAASGWELATAIGTILGAAATLAAVAGALWLGKRDRDAASESVDRQLIEQATSRLREHELGLLLRLQQEVARYVSRPGERAASESRALARGILLALADASRLVATREAFAAKEPAFSELPRFDNGQDDPTLRRNEALKRSPREIAEEIRRVARR